MPRPGPPLALGDHDSRQNIYPVLLYGRKVDVLYFNLRGYRGTLPLPAGSHLDLGEKKLGAYRAAIRDLNREWKKVSIWYEVVSSKGERQCFGTDYARAHAHLKRQRNHHIKRNDQGNWWYTLVEVTLNGGVRHERDVNVYQGEDSCYQMQPEFTVVVP